jgi:hypothetical protein
LEENAQRWKCTGSVRVEGLGSGDVEVSRYEEYRRGYENKDVRLTPENPIGYR